MVIDYNMPHWFFSTEDMAKYHDYANKARYNGTFDGHILKHHAYEILSDQSFDWDQIW